MDKFPDKILLTQDTETGNLHDEWVLKNLTQCKDMEYIRKDIFINKTCEFLKSYRRDYPDGTGYVEGIIDDRTIEKFKEYMKE